MGVGRRRQKVGGMWWIGVVVVVCSVLWVSKRKQKKGRERGKCARRAAARPLTSVKDLWRDGSCSKCGL